MAFSATINNTCYMGPGRTSLSGSWSGLAGDAAGTLTVAGTVIKANFYKFDNDNTWQMIARPTTSVASGITTLTINNQDNVVTGYFEIDKLGG
jgi:hypothetical protein